jgi:hypothetical protein
MTRLCVAWIALCTALPAPALAQEPAPTRGEVIVVLASEAPGQVDPSLREFAALRQPPFDGYRSMRVLSRTRVELVPGAPAEILLPNGRLLRVELLGLDGGRYRVRVSINRPHQRDYLPAAEVAAAPGVPFFIGGQGFESGTLVIGVRVG